MKNIFFCVSLVLLLAACATTPPTVAELCEETTLPILEPKTDWPSGVVASRAYFTQTAGDPVASCTRALELEGLTPEKRRQYSIFLAELHLVNEKDPAKALMVLDATPDTFGRDENHVDGLAIRAGFLRTIALYKLNRENEAIAVADKLVAARPYTAALHNARLSLILSAKKLDLSAIDAAMTLDNYNRPEMVIAAEVFGKFKKAIAILDAMAVTGDEQHRSAYDTEARLLELFIGQPVDRDFFETVLEANHGLYDDMSVAMAHAALTYLAYLDGDEEKRQRHFAALNDLPFNLSGLLLFEKLRETETAQTGRSSIPIELTRDRLDQLYDAWLKSGDTAFTSYLDISIALSRLPRIIDDQKNNGSYAIWMTEEKTSFSIHPADTADTTEIKIYTYADVPGIIVEEMAVLRAAELAKDEGKSHFLIRNKSLNVRVMANGQSKSETGTPYFRGYISVHQVTFTDNTPDSPYAKAAPFMLSADAVIAELGPRYRN